MNNTGPPADVAPSAAPTPDGARVTGPALDAHDRFLLRLVPTVERFPRSQKFLLRDRIQRTAPDVLECLLEVTYTRQRAHPLTQANLGIEKLRVLIRLAHDLHVLDRPQYEPERHKKVPMTQLIARRQTSVRRSARTCQRHLSLPLDSR